MKNKNKLVQLNLNNIIPISVSETVKGLVYDVNKVMDWTKDSSLVFNNKIDKSFTMNTLVAMGDANGNIYLFPNDYENIYKANKAYSLHNYTLGGTKKLVDNNNTKKKPSFGEKVFNTVEGLLEPQEFAKKKMIELRDYLNTMINSMSNTNQIQQSYAGVENVVQKHAEAMNHYVNYQTHNTNPYKDHIMTYHKQSLVSTAYPYSQMMNTQDNYQYGQMQGVTPYTNTQQNQQYYNPYNNQQYNNNVNQYHNTGYNMYNNQYNTPYQTTQHNQPLRVGGQIVGHRQTPMYRY